MNITNLTINQLHQNYLNDDFTPEQLVKYILEQASKRLNDNCWIHLMSLEEIQPYIDALKNKIPDNLPLYGIPFAIKDNIDLIGIPTTAACDAYTYTATKTAHVVERLINAGAIPIGKTNLDQFATGLVGTRSPYGETHNAFNSDYISGGSSSGSAVVVSQGLVTFSLGTDTAGSGRVPAAFNNILGMKPTRGLISCSGVVPACKSLDCVALFATTTVDLEKIFTVCDDFDPNDPYTRKNTKINSRPTLPTVNEQFTFAVPKQAQLKYFGNKEYEKLFSNTIAQLETLGGKKIEIDYNLFNEAALLLYQGPWVSERYIACQPLIDEQPDTLLDVTRGIIEQGRDKTAVDVYQSQYKINACKLKTDEIMSRCDFLLTPTTGTHYRIDEINNNPVELNSNLGYYTNYMNLLDYASIAVPAGLTTTGLPFGVTFVSYALKDKQLLAYAQMLQQDNNLNLGATQWETPSVEQNIINDSEYTNIVVCGAHMENLPLNHQLTDRGASLIKACSSATNYKLVALPGGPPYRPGMLRVEKGGKAIEVEVWSLPIDQLGEFLKNIPHPLGLGMVELDNGKWETGFICESYIEEQATDISHFGGWRQYLESL